jgi:hypothetical protein
MSPEHVEERFVFCTTTEQNTLSWTKPPLMTFIEGEGTTVIVTKGFAEEKGLEFGETWALITLTIHSDLTAVGLIAAVTSKLAEAKITVNVVSAYFHDHLFVPHDRLNEALSVLRKLSAEQ